jgi:methionine-rich copper-binding protein CopC
MRRLALMLYLLASPAFAHAILVDSTPSPNAHLKTGPLLIALRYNSRIDAGRSKVTLTGPGAKTLRLRLSDAGKQDMLQATSSVAPGAYTLRWQVLAIDGHITRGTVPFTVDAP